MLKYMYRYQATLHYNISSNAAIPISLKVFFLFSDTFAKALDTQTHSPVSKLILLNFLFIYTFNIVY